VEDVYFRLDGKQFALELPQAVALANRDSTSPLSLTIYLRIATNSTEPVDLNARGHAQAAFRQIASMYSDQWPEHQVSELGEALRQHFRIQ
jgi:hypothetical protein